MTVQWIPPYTEDDVQFLKHCKVDPWRHDGRGFKRDYKPCERKFNWLKFSIGAALLGFWVCVINWAIPLVKK